MSDYIVVNDDLRTMQIPDSITLLGVVSDDDVNKIPFQMPKEYCGYDLSTFSARINYVNANGTGDIYLVQDLEVDGDDPSLINFTWLVGRNACAYKGNVQFIVCLKKFAEDGTTVVQEFNTTVYSLPVLEGLETTDAVEQENADVIEQILQMIDEADMFDPSNYYTKAQTDSQIANALPTALPNPQKLIINGTEYDGSAEVEVEIVANTIATKTASGVFINVTDAVANEPIKSLTMYNSGGDVIPSASIAVANKNLFRVDLIADSVTSKGITFTKDSDGSITANGTSTGTYPATQCALDKNIFVVGNTYTISTGKTSGYLYVQLILNYTDGTTDYIVARNSARSFTLEKAVSSAVGSVQITDSGITLNNEMIYPQIEFGSVATAFVMNAYTSMTFDGTSMPVLPAEISNVWSNSDSVSEIEMDYESDVVAAAVDEYVRNNMQSNVVEMSVSHDGNGTVMLGVG